MTSSNYHLFMTTLSKGFVLWGHFLNLKYQIEFHCSFCILQSAVFSSLNAFGEILLRSFLQWNFLAFLNKSVGKYRKKNSELTHRRYWLVSRIPWSGGPKCCRTRRSCSIAWPTRNLPWIIWRTSARTCEASGWRKISVTITFLLY